MFSKCRYNIWLKSCKLLKTEFFFTEKLFRNKICLSIDLWIMRYKRNIFVCTCTAFFSSSFFYQLATLFFLSIFRSTHFSPRGKIHFFLVLEQRVKFQLHTENLGVLNLTSDPGVAVHMIRRAGFWSEV